MIPELQTGSAVDVAPALAQIAENSPPASVYRSFCEPLRLHVGSHTAKW